MEVYVIITNQQHKRTCTQNINGSVTAVEGVYATKPYFGKLAAVCNAMETEAIEVLKEGGVDVSKAITSVVQDTGWNRTSVVICGDITITTCVDICKSELVSECYPC